MGMTPHWGAAAGPVDPVKTAASLSVEQQVKDIRVWYDQIEADRGLKKTEIQADREFPYDPKLIRYVGPKGEIRKLVVELQSDHGSTQESYYFRKGELFFIYAVDSFWQFSGSVQKQREPETIDVESQLRFYFHQGRCIRALEKQAESQDATQLKTLIQKAENKPIELSPSVMVYQKKASALTSIRTVKDLEAFMNRVFK